MERESATARSPVPATWLGKLIALGPRGWALLLWAQLAILRAAFHVRVRPRGDLLGGLDLARIPSGEAAPGEAATVAAIGTAIDRVARAGLGRPSCLVRSLALQRMLVRSGVSGSGVRIGARTLRSGIEAHAWVEWRGQVVAEDPDFVRSFRPFVDLGGGFPDSATWADPVRPG